MARYADFRYGTRRYGSTPKAVSRSFILAQAIDYARVLLSLDVEERVGSGFLITRTRSGAAEDPSNGVIIASGVFTSPTYTFIDGENNFEDASLTNDVRVPSGILYYTLFIFDSTGAWFRDAATSLIVPRDQNTNYRMAVNLPRAFTSSDGNPISPTDLDSTLMRFLGGFAVTYDEWTTALDLIVPSTSRARGIVRRLHEAYAMSVGMPVEVTIGVAASSRLFRDSGLIYKEKGTLPGIQKYVEALTNWNTIVTETPNLLLSLNDASFETDIGAWGCVGGDITREMVNGGTVTAPEAEFEDPLNAFPSDGVGRIVLSTTVAEASLPFSGLRGEAIPVSPGTMYYLKVPARTVAGSPSLTTKVEWLAQSGEALSTDTLATSEPASSWSIVSGSATAVAGAYFARIVLQVDGQAGDAVDVDMISFCSSDTHYRDPRSVDVICGPARLNLLSDPSFEGSGYWTADEGTLTHDADEVFLGLKSGKCEGNSFRVSSEVIPELPNYPLTLSAYSKGSGTGNFLFEFLDSDGIVLSTQSIPATVEDDWSRNDATILPDPSATNLRLVLSGEGVVYFDAISLERADRPLVYFDGSVSDQTGEDSKIAIVDGHVYSLLYPNRLVKVIRLRQTLPFYLPMGVTARVLLWDSPDPAVKELLPYGV